MENFLLLKVRLCSNLGVGGVNHHGAELEIRQIQVDVLANEKGRATLTQTSGCADAPQRKWTICVGK